MTQQLWERYKKYLCVCPATGLRLDISRMNFPEDFFTDMDDPIHQAFDAMQALEGGAIANPDENRMVGHYWLRAPELAPTPELRREIEDCLEQITTFAADVHAGKIRSECGNTFQNLLVIGIGGSALGPQFVSDALGTAEDKMKLFFFDNTDPDGVDRTVSQISRHGGLEKTLCVVISKSGGTPETRNGMLEAMDAFARTDHCFRSHAVAVTSAGSELDKLATQQNWLARFPMWDWVGGRTSQTAAVGLLPACLQGLDIKALLAGAREMDAATRSRDVLHNPAALMALMWYYASNGKGEKDLVILPYKDRLCLFSKYLQQLIMESLGKELDLDGETVNQGLTVYGNKGSTDQHAYIQQLRDGVANFFVTFIEVLRDRTGRSLRVDPDVTAGDYLSGFLYGTREALHSNGRESMTLTVEEVSPGTVGALIALFERAVGFYASLININAYHQPGVQAGKVAAASVLELQGAILKDLHNSRGKARTTEAISESIGQLDRVEDVFHILEHLASNPDRGITRHEGDSLFNATWTVI